MQNDIVADYIEVEEPIEFPAVERIKQSKSISNKRNRPTKINSWAENDSLNTLCKSMDCLDLFSDFGATRGNNRLKLMFEKFNTDLLNEIESQMFRRLKKKAEKNKL